MRRQPTAIVTGAAGFIGSHLAERLLADGHRVVGVDALRRPDEAAANLAPLAREPRFELVEHDLREPLPDALPRGATIYHLAGRPGSRGTDAEALAADNVEATGSLLGSALALLARRVVFASSSSVYGPAAAGPVSERVEPAPATPYAETKRAAERLVLGYGRHPVVLRYFSVYGPRQRRDMALARFVDAVSTGASVPLYQDGMATRDFTFVDDVVDATVRAGHHGHAGAVYNVGAGRPVALGEALQRVGALLGRRVRCEPARSPVHEAHETWADTTRARGHLGWRPATRFEEGLRRTFSGGVVEARSQAS